MSEKPSDQELFEHRTLTAEDLILGVGRKITHEELLGYLLKNDNKEEIDIDAVFKEYED